MSVREAAERHAGEPASDVGLRATRCGEVLSDTYRLLELVGTGGMAEVYAAEHLRLGRRFAIKVLRAGTGQHSLQRFRREARAIARIESEFVVGVVDCGEASDGTPYLVMDLLKGEDLRTLLEREGRLPIPRAVNLVIEACRGIAAVHATALVHRDLKPENLFVSKRSTGEDWCRVLDFGIAKSDLSNSTVEGAVVGTVRYMAPEQLQDAASAGPSVDIYALGAVLYECLAGAAPHRGSTVQELMFNILNKPAAPLEDSRSEVPKALAFAVARALAKTPAQRFANVEQFAAAVAPYARLSNVDARDARAPTIDLERQSVAPNWVRRSSRKAYGAIALSGIVGVGAGVAISRPDPPLNAPVSPAPSAQARASSLAPVSTISASAPEAPPATIASATSIPMSSAVPQKVRANAPVHRPSVTSHTRFDSENPYGG